jgi:hypothetical protein
VKDPDYYPPQRIFWMLMGRAALLIGLFLLGMAVIGAIGRLL